MRKRARSRPLAAYVVALLLIVLLPALLLAAVTTHAWVSAERERLETSITDANDDALAKIDTFMVGQIAMLQALATSPALDSGDFERFDQQARELLNLQGTNVVLRDQAGQQRVNTRVPWGTTLPNVGPVEADRRVAETKRPYVSDLKTGAVAREPILLINVPVIRRDAVAYFLNASIPARAITDLLAKNVTQPDHYATVADRNGVIIARSTQADEYVGKALPRFGEASADRGFWSGVNVKGVPVVASYRRSSLSGWLIAVGVPRSALEAALRRSQWLFGGLVAVLAFAATSAAFWLMRRIMSAHAKLADAARRVGEGRPAIAVETGIAETDSVGDALAAASAKLNEQAAALISANRELEARVEERTAQLAAKTALLEATLNNMDQGLMMIAADGSVPVWNERALALLELPRELMLDKPSFERVRQHQIERGEFAGMAPAFRRWIETSRMEETYRSYERERPNGTVLEIRTVPLRDGSVVRTYTDITARREGEKALRESEERYRVLAENTTDMIVRNSLEGVRLYVSPAARRILGYEPHEMVGKRPADITHPDDKVSLLGQVAAVVSGQVDRDSAIYRLLHKDGHWVWVEANFQLIRDAEGRPESLISAVRDVTERRMQAEQLRIARDAAELLLNEAQRASEAKSDFLAAMSHEIRTPLNSIIGFTDLLLRESEPADGRRRFLDIIRQSGVALLTVVNDVLDFSKIEAGQVELRHEAFCLFRLIENATSIIGGVIGAKNLQVVTRVDADVPAWVVGDPDRLQQVLLNLLNNAVKFTPSGTVTMTVDYEESCEGGARLRFSVKDTGIGIPADKQERLFQRFSQVDGSIRREYGGTGLGLAICKRLIELMGGRIGVESSEGQGSTFWFTLVLPRAEATAAEAQSHAGAGLFQSRARILLAEDLEVNQELARAVLASAGHDVDQRNGTDSLPRRPGSEHPDRRADGQRDA